MAKLFTQVQHRRGTSAALNAEKNNNIKYLAGEIILENIGTDAANWHGSESTTKYLLRVGNDGKFSTASCVWAHAVDVPSWLKVNTKPEGLGDGDVTILLNSMSTSINGLSDKVGTSSVISQITSEIGKLNYTYSGTGDIVTSVSQSSGKIEITKGTITESMLTGVGYATLKDSIDNTTTGLKKYVADLKSAVGTTGDTAAQTGSIQARLKYLDSHLTTAEGNIDTLTTNLGTINTASEITAFGKIKTLEGLATGLRTDLGNSSDSSDSSTAFGRIKAVEEAIGSGTGTGTLSGRVNALERDLGTPSDAQTKTTAFGKIAKNAADIAANKSSIEGHGTKIGNLEAAVGDASSGLVKEVAELKSNIGDLTNIMNFRGAVTATSDITDPNVGDVVVIISTGVEYVYSDATNKWVELGNSTATSSAISGLDSRLTTAEGNITVNTNSITTINNKIGADATSGTILYRIKANETSIGTINETLGDLSDADGALDDRLTTVEDLVGKTASAGLRKSVADNASNINTNATAITNINSALGTLGTASTTTAFGKIKTAEADIDALQETVGDSTKGLVKTSAEHTTAISAINEKIGNSSDIEGTTIYGKIAVNAGAINTNTADITKLKGFINNGYFGLDASNNLIFFTGFSDTSSETITIDGGVVTE